MWNLQGTTTTGDGMKTRCIETTGIADADQLTAEVAVLLRDGGLPESDAFEQAMQVRDRYRAAFSDWRPAVQPKVWVSTTSHRSRQKLARLIPDLGPEYGVWAVPGPRGAYYEVPASFVPALERIKGLTVLKGAPSGGHLFKRWGQD